MADTYTLNSAQLAYLEATFKHITEGALREEITTLANAVSHDIISLTHDLEMSVRREQSQELSISALHAKLAKVERVSNNRLLRLKRLLAKETSDE